MPHGRRVQETQHVPRPQGVAERDAQHPMGVGHGAGLCGHCRGARMRLHRSERLRVKTSPTHGQPLSQMRRGVRRLGLRIRAVQRSAIGRHGPHRCPTRTGATLTVRAANPHPDSPAQHHPPRSSEGTADRHRDALQPDQGQELAQPHHRRPPRDPLQPPPMGQRAHRRAPPAQSAPRVHRQRRMARRRPRHRRPQRSTPCPGHRQSGPKHIHRCDTTPQAVASKQQIGVETLHDLINGHSWPDFFTVARLEIHFERRLWGHEHKPRRRKFPAT